MPNDEEIDKAIDEIIAKSKISDEDIKKRKPKPFRYLTNEEIQDELKEETVAPKTIMSVPEEAKIVDDKSVITGLGDVEAIETVIRRHEVSRKFKEK